MNFDGDFDFLPIRSDLTYSEVPLYPISEDFHLAVSTWEHDRTPEAAWRLEAIKARLASPGAKLDDLKKVINTAVAARLYRECRETA